MKIILSGFEFESSNKGCEALSYSVISLLDSMEELKPLEIVVINIHESMGEFSQRYPHITFTNLRMRTKRLSFWNSLKKEMKSAAVVLDITHGDSFSDIYGKKWFAETTLVKSFVACSRVPLILMPQTYGPFEARWSKRWAIWVIKKASKVYTRDHLSLEYLKDLGIRDTVQNTIDLAFMLPYKKNNAIRHSGKARIGFNVSGLLWDDSKKNNRFGLRINYVEYCRTVLKQLVKNGNCEIHLVPHVLCDLREGEDFFENDSKAIRELLKEFPTCYFQNDFKTALDVKNYICNLDFLVAPRMHASIAAFSSGVPVVPFAYSRKFNGVYSDMRYDHIIDARVVDTEDAVKITLCDIEKRDELMNDEHYGIGIIKKRHEEFCCSLLEVIQKRI